MEKCKNSQLNILESWIYLYRHRASYLPVLTGLKLKMVLYPETHRKFLTGFYLLDQSSPRVVLLRQGQEVSGKLLGVLEILTQCCVLVHLLLLPETPYTSVKSITRGCTRSGYKEQVFFFYFFHICLRKNIYKYLALP